MIEFVCATCGKSLHVAEQFAGRRAKCPKCHTPVTIPGAPVDRPDAAPTPPADAASEPASEPAPEQPADPAATAPAPDDPLAALVAAAGPPVNTPVSQPRKRRTGTRTANSGTNGIGLAGFIVSLAGLVLCILPACPVGLILSIIGIRRNPRGFAIAGLVLGIIGTVPMIVIPIVWGTVILAFLSTPPSAGAHAKTQAALEKGGQAIAAFKRASATFLPTLTARRSSTTSATATVTSSVITSSPMDISKCATRADGTFNTPDDITITGSGESPPPVEAPSP